MTLPPMARYVYGPVTRAMMQTWLCRVLDDEKMYLKSDLQYECYKRDHK